MLSRAADVSELIFLPYIHYIKLLMFCQGVLQRKKPRHQGANFQTKYLLEVNLYYNITGKIRNFQAHSGRLGKLAAKNPALPLFYAVPCC